MPAANRHVSRWFCIFLQLAAGVALLALTGCRKKSGDAIVIGKEYFPAAQIEVTPNEAESPAPTVSPTPVTIAERWIAHVEMVYDLRKMDVDIPKARWEGLKEGDRVQVTYREGKYTSTVWSAELE